MIVFDGSYMSAAQIQLIIDTLTIARVLNLDLSKYADVTDTSQFLNLLSVEIERVLVANKNRDRRRLNGE